MLGGLRIQLQQWSDKALRVPFVQLANILHLPITQWTDEDVV